MDVQSIDFTRALRSALIELARREDEIAAAEASLVPYWEPFPLSVYGHRAAAEALRSEAESIAFAA